MSIDGWYLKAVTCEGVEARFFQSQVDEEAFEPFGLIRSPVAAARNMHSWLARQG